MSTLDYEVGFKLVVGALMTWFWLDKRATRDDIRELQKKTSRHATEVAVLKERVDSIKEDTKAILAKLDK
jgi:hypothetical protein